MKQYLSFNRESSSVQVTKDYTLKIKNTYGKISIVKICDKKGCSNTNKINNNHLLFDTLSPEEVYNQLANIHHIGFEVTDSCNLKCTYCIYGNLYDNHEPRLDKKIDIKSQKS
ncbi:MAG: hypothetical protein PARBB_02668 [Parabacteroides distasonis]